MDLIDVLHRLYASEINVEITSFYDSGFGVKLGDHMNGYKAEANFHPDIEGDPPGVFRSLHDAAWWLDAMAREHYPESQYAKRLYCCAITDGVQCDETAEWVLYGRTGQPDDFTHSCSTHIGELIGDQPGYPIVGSVFQAMPICGICGGENPDMHPNPHCFGCSPWKADHPFNRTAAAA